MTTKFEHFKRLMADRGFISRAPSDDLFLSMPSTFAFPPPRSDLADAFALASRVGGVDLRRDSMMQIINTGLDMQSAFEKLAVKMRAAAGAMADLWIAFARVCGITTTQSTLQAAERMAAACLAGAVLSARQIRHLARTVGTSEHYGWLDGIEPPELALFQQAARVCDDPFSGGDFGAWLFWDEGEDW